MFRGKVIDDSDELNTIFQMLKTTWDDDRGACQPVAMLGIYAFFIKREEIFKFILSVDNFPEKLQLIQAKLDSGFNENDLSREDRQIAELIPFFKGAEVNLQDSNGATSGIAKLVAKFEYFFKSQDKYMTSFNDTGVFHKEGGLEKFSSILGIYSLDDLIKLFEVISSAAQKANVDFACLLSGPVNKMGLMHGISVCYHHESKSWRVIDINNIYEADEFDTDMSMVAYKIHRDYTLHGSLNDDVVIEIKILGLGKDKNAILEMVNNIITSPVYKKIHLIDRNTVYRDEEMNISLLHVAALRGYHQIIKDLADHKANLTRFSSLCEATPLGLATFFGEYASIAPLVQGGVDVDARCAAQGSTLYDFRPIYLAAGYGHERFLSTLILHGADINQAEPELRGMTPLHWAVMLGRVNIIKTLINMNADVNAKAFKNVTPIHVAAVFGDVDAFAAVLAAGADLNARDDDGSTPFALAVLFGHYKIVRLILQSGFDRDTPIFDTEEKWLASAVGPEQIEKMKILIANKIKNGASVDKVSLTAYELACLREDKEMLDVLTTNPLVAARAATRHSSLANVSVFKSDKQSYLIASVGCVERSETQQSQYSHEI